MKKITLLLFAMVAFCWQSNAQVLSEGFDVDPAPGWTNEYVSATVDWQIAATANQNSTVAPRTGAGMAAFISNNYNGDQTRLVSPSMDLSVLPSQVLSFYYTQEDWGGDQDELRVYYKTSAAGAWVLLAEFTADTNPVWTEVNLVLPNPSADYYVALDGTSGYGRGITVDDLVIDNAPSCLTPGSLSVFGTSPTDAELSWIPAGSETDFTYEYGATGFVQGTGTTGMVTGNTASISGLTADTDYDFYVQANCGVDGDSGFAGPFTWTQPDAGDSCGTAYVATLEADCGTATPISLDFTGAPSNISTSCDTFNNYGLWITATTDAAGGLTVNASAAVDMAIYDMCGGTDIGCYNASIAPSVDVVLSPNTQYYLYFWQEGTASTAMVDVCISSYTPAPAPDCAEAPIVPADVATDVAGGLVNLSWTAPSSGPAPTDYEVFFGETSGALTSLGLVGSTDTNIDVTGLGFNTTYYWSIVPINGSTPAVGPCAEWSFTTGNPPPGDDCTNPLVVGALPYNDSGDTASYNDVYDGTPGATGCGSTSSYLGGNDVVYSYTAASDGSINVALSGVGTYTGIFMYTDCADIGTACANGAVNGFAGGDIALDDVAVTNGTTYYFVISTWPSPQTTAYTLDITENTCTNATVAYAVVNDCDVSGGFNIEVDITDMGTATALTVSDDQGSATQPATGVTTLTFGPYANATDVVITVVDDNDAGCTQSSSALTQAACPPDNIDCASAALITCDETINATSVGSTGTSEDIGCAMGVNGIWYTFVGTGGDMTVSVDASFDHRVGIASGSCGTLANIVCDDQSTGTESHTFASVLAETYYVYIAHYSSGNTTTGTIDITLTCAAIPVCEAAAFDAGTIDDSGCNPDGTGTYTVDIFVEEVGDGGTFEDGTNSYPVVAGTVTAGPYNSGDIVTIEYVNGDTDCDSTVGTFDFNCPLPPPANDEVAGAIDLPVGDTMCEDAVLADNVAATTSVENINTADCTFAGGIPLGDVWYSVTVPSTGEVTVETSDSGGGITDTVMTVYRGTSGSLEEIGCSDDEGTGAFSLIELTAADGISPGDVLLVRVWEYGDNVKGTFNVCAWSPTTLGIDDNTLGQFTYYPNPVNNTLTLNAQNTIEDVTLYNMLGQVVLKATPNAVNTDVDMSALSNGAYFVQVTIVNITKTVRVIKQ